jgi:hypothetical protein
MDEVTEIYEKYYKLDMILELIREGGLVACFEEEFGAAQVVENLLYLLCNNTYSNPYLLYRRKKEERLSFGELWGIQTDILGLNKLLVMKVLSPHTGLQVGDIICKVNGKSPLSYFSTAQIKQWKIHILRYQAHQMTYKMQDILWDSDHMEVINFHNTYDPERNYLKVESFAGCDRIPILPSGKTAITMDFRNNLGGAIGDAVSFLEFFLPAGTVVCYEKRREAMLPILIQTNEMYHFENIILFVNELTASAAEIVVFALQKYCNAEVVGATTHTFGKECMQHDYIFDDDSYLGVPVSHIYTPDETPMTKHSIKIDRIMSHTEEAVFPLVHEKKSDIK